jgi:hypothetical protein
MCNCLPGCRSHERTVILTSEVGVVEASRDCRNCRPLSTVVIGPPTKPLFGIDTTLGLRHDSAVDASTTVVEQVQNALYQANLTRSEMRARSTETWTRSHDERSITYTSSTTRSVLLALPPSACIEDSAT